MTSVTTQLRDLRLKVEALQVEVAGRQHISSMVVWEEQNASSVNGKTSRMQEDFSGLVIHLMPDASPVEGTESPETLSQNEFNELKQQLLNERSIQLGEINS